jgi:hypothetical protein
VPWASTADLRATLGSSAHEAPPFTELRSGILAAQAIVRRNWEGFTAFDLSAEHLDYAFWRDSVVREAAQAQDARSAALLIGTIAERDSGLVEKLDADWNRGRFSDSPGKLQFENKPDICKTKRFRLAF